MGVDLHAAIGHKFSKSELLKLPELFDQISKVTDLKSSWDYSEMTEIDLENIWRDWELDTNEYGDINFKNQVNCFWGNVDVWRNVLVIEHFPEHKYSNLANPVAAKKIIGTNRHIAKALGESKIVYFPDSTFPTSILDTKTQEGFTIDEIINYGIKEFGQPPENLVEGMKFMFFIDVFQNLDNELIEWNWFDEKYWKYNWRNGRYEKK
ncbi:MAG: hypothetical protein LBV72_09845 [Tannerella sp.]|jgi:hypothetical protein|nr:hypothetical protein [Tannerella sp.]